MSVLEHLEFKTKIAKFLFNGWVTDSNSQFAAPVIFIIKLDGFGLRMCIDSSGLNAITTRDRDPLTYLDDLIHRRHGSRVFTKVDQASGYYQLLIYLDDRHKMAFVTLDGFYEWTVIPFGLANVPSAFRHVMLCIFALYKRFAVEYVNEVRIFTRSLAQNKMHVDRVRLAIRGANLRLNEQKCVFGASEMSFVSFKGNLCGIHSGDRKIAIINDYQVPAGTARLRSFLWLAGYYRTFMHKFAHGTTQLYPLTADTCTIRWLQNDQAEFNNIWMVLVSAPVPALRDPECNYILHTDASDMAI
jgi:hypothetical protein